MDPSGAPNTLLPSRVSNGWLVRDGDIGFGFVNAKGVVDMKELAEVTHFSPLSFEIEMLPAKY